MSLRTPKAALIVAAVLLPAAPAAAAPARTGEVKTIGEKYTWSSDVAVGAVYGSPVAPKAPHCSQIFSCDDTLVKVGEYGDVQFDIAGVGFQGQDTLKDIDLHVYSSDASGAIGELQGESTSANPSESVSLLDMEPGYYFVEVDWFLGVGSYDGTVQSLPPTPPDDGSGDEGF